jgi:hypothetical protein
MNGAFLRGLATTTLCGATQGPVSVAGAGAVVLQLDCAVAAIAPI